MQNITLIPAVIMASLTYLVFSEILSNSCMIDGEVVYTGGFIIVLYIIWREFYKINDLTKPFFGYFNLASFWFKYKALERLLLILCFFKLGLIRIILRTFTYTISLLKSLNFLKKNAHIYKHFIYVLNKIKLKTKTLPLQV